MELNITINDLSKEQQVKVRDKYFDLIMRSIENEAFIDSLKIELEQSAERVVDWITSEISIGKAVDLLEARIEQAIIKEFRK